MTTETDHLALLAAKTVLCPDCAGISKQGWPTCTYDDLEKLRLGCAICKGSGRVLDPRFEKLRQECFPFDGASYTVVRDLGVLLDCIPIDRALSLYRMKSGTWACNIVDGHGEADTHLEAVGHAVYDWVEAQEQVVTG